MSKGLHVAMTNEPDWRIVAFQVIIEVLIFIVYGPAVRMTDSLSLSSSLSSSLNSVQSIRSLADSSSFNRDFCCSHGPKVSSPVNQGGELTD